MINWKVYKRRYCGFVVFPLALEGTTENHKISVRTASVLIEIWNLYSRNTSQQLFFLKHHVLSSSVTTM